MKSDSESRYYIYGISLASDEIAYIDWTENPPDEMPGEILFELEQLKGEALMQMLSQFKRSTKSEIFELEIVSCKEEAIRATEFWRNSCRFLGLSLLNSPPDSHNEHNN